MGWVHVTGAVLRLFHDNVRRYFRWGQLNPWVASAMALLAGSAGMGVWWGIRYLLLLSLA